MPIYHRHYLIVIHLFVMALILLYLFLIRNISQLLKDIILNVELVGTLQFHLTTHNGLKHLIPRTLRLNFFMLSILHFLMSFNQSIRVQTILIQLCNILFIQESKLKFLLECSRKVEYLNA